MIYTFQHVVAIYHPAKRQCKTLWTKIQSNKGITIILLECTIDEMLEIMIKGS